ncbi:hypothetical protein GIY30_13725 [Gordonia sp. HNM0687]|uniref:SMP-30/Gluconolactonase/LRE-like region domain-containing protein n=1 Tax=Gordonia mangrovi TaxID=2665643 RepID=A0A6L7GR32_9ACTN|nr:SMP-30/gluconolactonase/LRE family protein [Gordonia mangrovi]MXP22399.1 hypothetical protein [Gordonia mangrovi]UVF77718.1 shufflon system plasmid conjugative transfer pilus tip adhesin PilV [Gordonia mangrovi]
MAAACLATLAAAVIPAPGNAAPAVPVAHQATEMPPCPQQLLSMNPDDGSFQAYARQLVSQGNGLTRGPDGSIYASNDLAASLDKILPNGHVIKGFYQGGGTNGGTVSKDGKTLYVTETFTLDAKVLAIDTTTGEPVCGRVGRGSGVADLGRRRVVVRADGR